jgi:hypothetical protein
MEAVEIRTTREFKSAIDELLFLNAPQVYRWGLWRAKSAGDVPSRHSAQDTVWTQRKALRNATATFLKLTT